MIDFINNSNPVIAALIATMFTYAVTVLGAALLLILQMKMLLLNSVTIRTAVFQ